MDQLISKIVDGAVEPFLTFVFALATAIFIWGIIEFIAGADNEEKRGTGKKHLVWGIIGMFVMFAVYGIIKIIENFIGTLG